MRLTNQEIFLLVCVVLILVTGGIVRSYRQAHPPANQGSINAPSR